MAEEPSGVTFVQPELTVHTFRDKILNQDIYFQVIKLHESFIIWFGKSEKLGDLSVAMATLKGMVSAANLIGGMESHSVALAERLSKKTGKQVFIGGDMNSFDQLQYPLVEKRIMEEMTKHPEQF
ncbi:proteasome assembly chaperone 4-like [Mya arenaria]|nr:proteasome assembly chaperone 4-like [Mya arenaria]